MSELPRSAPSERPKRSGCSVLLVLLVVGVALFTAATNLFFPWQAAFYLLAGWAFYLYRVVPQVQVAPWPVAVALGCTAGLAWGGHRFASWLWASHPAGAGRPWRWRWTLSGLAGFVAVFAAGIATIGIVHQTVWLVRGPIVDSTLGRSTQKRAMSDLRSIGTAVESYQVDHGHVPELASGRVAVLEPWLKPTFIRELRLVDPWGQPYRWRHEPGAEGYSVVCWGKDRARDASVTLGATTAFAADIYFSDGAFTVYPEGTQK